MKAFAIVLGVAGALNLGLLALVVWRGPVRGELRVAVPPEGHPGPADVVSIDPGRPLSTAGKPGDLLPLPGMAGYSRDTAKIHDRVVHLNETRKIRIHCISIGKSSDFMKALAEATGGSYVEFL